MSSNWALAFRSRLDYFHCFHLCIHEPQYLATMCSDSWGWLSTHQSMIFGRLRWWLFLNNRYLRIRLSLHQLADLAKPHSIRADSCLIVNLYSNWYKSCNRNDKTIVASIRTQSGLDHRYCVLIAGQYVCKHWDSYLSQRLSDFWRYKEGVKFHQRMASDSIGQNISDERLIMKFMISWLRAVISSSSR